MEYIVYYLPTSQAKPVQNHFPMFARTSIFVNRLLTPYQRPPTCILHHFTSSPLHHLRLIHSIWLTRSSLLHVFVISWILDSKILFFFTQNAGPADRELDPVLLSYRQHTCCLLDSRSATKEERRSTASRLWGCSPYPLHHTHGATSSRPTSFRRYMLRCRHRCDWYDRWFQFQALEANSKNPPQLVTLCCCHWSWMMLMARTTNPFGIFSIISASMTVPLTYCKPKQPNCCLPQPRCQPGNRASMAVWLESPIISLLNGCATCGASMEKREKGMCLVDLRSM